MNAGREPEPVVRVRELLGLGTFRGGRSDRDRTSNAHSPGIGQDLIHPPGERRKGEMAVGIDHGEGKRGSDEATKEGKRQQTAFGRRLQSAPGVRQSSFSSLTIYRAMAYLAERGDLITLPAPHNRTC